MPWYSEFNSRKIVFIAHLLVNVVPFGCVLINIKFTSIEDMCFQDKISLYWLQGKIRTNIGLNQFVIEPDNFMIFNDSPDIPVPLVESI